jgi:chromatin remodeling complex protein RSC6
MAKYSRKVQEVPKVVEEVREVVPEEPVNDEMAQGNQTEPRRGDFERLMTRLEQTQSELKLLKADLHKFYTLTNRDYRKANKGRRRTNPDRSPTGFGKAGEVPAGLQTLLGLGKDEQLARPEVTNRLYKYFDEHNLRDIDDLRILRVDDRVSKAFGLTPAQVFSINTYKKAEDGKVDKKKGLNFYNLQRFVASLYKGKPIVIEDDEHEPVAEPVAEPVPVVVQVVEKVVVEPPQHSKRNKKAVA